MTSSAADDIIVDDRPICPYVKCGLVLTKPPTGSRWFCPDHGAVAIELIERSVAFVTFNHPVLGPQKFYGVEACALIDAYAKTPGSQEALCASAFLTLLGQRSQSEAIEFDLRQELKFVLRNVYTFRTPTAKDWQNGAVRDEFTAMQIRARAVLARLEAIDHASV